MIDRNANKLSTMSIFLVFNFRMLIQNEKKKQRKEEKEGRFKEEVQPHIQKRVLLKVSKSKFHY